MNTQDRFFATCCVAATVLFLSASAIVAADINVPGDQATIQAAIDAASAGDTILVAAGTYDEVLNIDGKTDLSIVGADPATTILQPSATQSWAIPGYSQYDSRQVAVRVYNSTGITLSNLTCDFDLIKGNYVYGVLFFSSTGSLADNVLENMSADDASGFYGEVASYFWAPAAPYDASNRAPVTISGNTFINAGRLAILVHGYTDATVSGNEIYKNIADFGYGMEIGSESQGTVSGNTIYGYDTAALSDGSESGGIYVENAFTGAVTGVTKTVVLENNEIYDCQWGIVIGNEWDGFAGDVDIVATLSGNYVHDNTTGGILLTDEDASAGSSVTIGGGANTLENNPEGYYLYTQGDGDLSVNLSWDGVRRNGTGIHVEDTAGGASTSTYSLAFDNCDISGNTTFGINNTIPTVTVGAENCWWGDATGPHHPTANPGGLGDEVSDGVDFDPYDSTYVALKVGNQLGLYCDKAVLTVNLDSAAPVQAFSFGVAYDPSLFSLTEITYSGLSAIEGCNGGTGPEDYSVDLSPTWDCAGTVDPALTAGATVYCLASNTPTPGNVIPAGNDHPIARLIFEPTGTATLSSTSAVRIVDCLGTPPWDVKATVNYTSQVPAITDGQITVGTCSFLRGDSNHDVDVDISDSVCILGYLFTAAGCPFIKCFDAADANDDGSVDIADPIYVLNYLFRGQAMPPLPFPTCGMDPTLSDTLPCPNDVCP